MGIRPVYQENMVSNTSQRIGVLLVLCFFFLAGIGISRIFSLKFEVLTPLELAVQIESCLQNPNQQSATADETQQTEPSNGNNCFRELARTLLSRHQLPEILRTAALIEQNPEMYTVCHQFTHDLGYVAYEIDQDVAGVYAFCDHTCHSGCYHGVLQHFFQEQEIQLDVHAAEDLQLKSLCDAKTSSMLEYSECIHGLGHGLLYLTNFDFPVSLEFCDVFETVSDRENCYGGVFMEYYVWRQRFQLGYTEPGIDLSHFENNTQLEDVMYPCTILDEKYLQSCYSSQASYFYDYTDGDHQKVAELCADLEPQYQEGCFGVFGADQISSGQDMQVMAERCVAFSEKYVEACLSGILSGSMTRFPQQVDRHISFCESLPEERKEFCYTQIIRIYDSQIDSNSSILDQVCSSIADRQYVACLNR
jgi:hypothetical protein